jgi:hypothetical protein
LVRHVTPKVWGKRCCCVIICDTFDDSLLVVGCLCVCIIHRTTASFWLRYIVHDVGIFIYFSFKKMAEIKNLFYIACIVLMKVR